VRNKKERTTLKKEDPGGYGKGRVNWYETQRRGRIIVLGLDPALKPGS
jgi:hypothetical protein